MAQSVADQIPQGEAFDRLVEFTQLPAAQLTQTLYDSHNIGMVWYIMGAIGVVTCIGLFFYAKFIYALHKQQAA